MTVHWFGFCCKGGNCLVFEDDFDDDAGTVLSSDWTEESGDWEYTGTNLLKENGNKDACVLTTAQTHTREQSVTCDIKDIAVGDKPRLIANAVDEDNYFFVEMQQGTIDVIVRLFKRTGGVNALLHSALIVPQLDTPIASVAICIDDKSFTWSVFPVLAAAETFVYDCEPALFVNGKKAGLGNGDTSVIEFDTFALSNFWGKDGGAGECLDKQCCKQQCTCCDGDVETCIKRDLMLTFEAGGGCLAGLDGLTVPLTFVPVSNVWVSDPTSDLPPCLSNAQWILTCAEHDCSPAKGEGDLYSLVVVERDTGNCHPDHCMGIESPGHTGSWQASFTCDPFSITFPVIEYEFDPLSIPGPCDCCDEEDPGWWQGTVTEAP
jgi:hypothetical protein